MVEWHSLANVDQEKYVVVIFTCIHTKITLSTRIETLATVDIHD